VVRDNSVRLQSLTDTRGKPSAYPLYIHCRLTGTARNRWTRASGIDKLGAEMDQRVLPPARRLAVGNRQSRPYCRQKLGDAIKAQCPLSFSRPSRGDPLPPVFLMEAAVVHHPLCQDSAQMFLAQLRNKKSLGGTLPRLEFIQTKLCTGSSTTRYVHRKYVLDKHD
jgi:hypothetical protein